MGQILILLWGLRGFSQAPCLVCLQLVLACHVAPAAQAPRAAAPATTTTTTNRHRDGNNGGGGGGGGGDNSSSSYRKLWSYLPSRGGLGGGVANLGWRARAGFEWEQRKWPTTNTAREDFADATKG